MKKNDWVELFRETGLDDAMMAKWHRLFETRFPEEHQNFLAWLGLSPDEIQKVRSQSL